MEASIIHYQPKLLHLQGLLVKLESTEANLTLDIDCTTWTAAQTTMYAKEPDYKPTSKKVLQNILFKRSKHLQLAIQIIIIEDLQTISHQLTQFNKLQ